MRILKATVAVAASVIALAAQGSAASGATLHVNDPAGDGLKGPRLDITSVDISNRARAVVTKISFVRASIGDLAIYYWAEGDTRRQQIRVVSSHGPHQTRNRVDTINGRESCEGLRVVWDHEADTVKVRLPARCFHGGQYDDIRIRAITEIGGDADLVRETARGWAWTRWIARG